MTKLTKSGYTVVKANYTTKRIKKNKRRIICETIYF